MGASPEVGRQEVDAILRHCFHAVVPFFEEEMELDPNELFFQLQEKEWEEECTLEVRLHVCGPDP